MSQGFCFLFELFAALGEAVKHDDPESAWSLTAITPCSDLPVERTANGDGS